MKIIINNFLKKMNSTIGVGSPKITMKYENFMNSY
jgi:hypothetical protein